MSRTGSIGRFVPESDSVKILKNVVQSSYPNLNAVDQNTLHKYIYFLIQYIAVCFDFYSDVDGFRTKMEQNSYKDCRWLLTYLIPYVDTETISLVDIKNLSDLYTLEEPDQVKHDIPHEDSMRFPNMQSIIYRSPRYVFSNIQYSRFDRHNSYKTVRYEESHIRHNFALLMKTIKDVRYKMYVNWIDIVPIRMDNYKETRLYDTTKKGLQNISDWDPLDMTMSMSMTMSTTNESIDKFEPDVSDLAIDSFYSKTLGLNIGDIYNTINSDLYGSIVQYKWLLFDIYTASSGTGSSAKRITQPILYVLRDMFGIQLMLSGASYDELSSDDRNAFDTKFRELQSMYGSTSGSASSASILHPSAVDTLVSSIVLFYNQKYSKIKRKGYVPLPPNMTRKNPDDYDHNRSYDKTVILTTLKSMDPISVYDFIVEALEGFKSTWFGLKLLNSDKTDVVDVAQCNYAVLESGDYVTYKNIYNFCKSIVHHTRTVSTNENTYIRYPALWDAIDDTGKTDFTDRIRGTKDYRPWFNIFSNLLHPIKMYDPSIDAKDRQISTQINEHMSDIYNLLKISIIDIVFETMIAKGILSTMIANTELTNAQLYDVSDSVKKSNLVKAVSGLYFSPESPYMKHCYFYMTNTPYNKVGTHIVDIDNKKQKLNYMIAQSTISLAPYINTAYHWVAQIGFCHKFIHNRVSYITGATGAGKSTEIPKFYLYYLKSLDRIDDGTVVITVPRKNAAEKTSDYISKQLALPYNVFDSDSDLSGSGTSEPSIKNRSNLFYVQFKHSGDRHISSGRFPKMRFVTDGSVIDDIKDPMIRSKRVGKHGKYVYGRSDLFNILLVDEAHEHNANMDIILSMAKNAAYYNNRFRLCIVSATMAEDEPVYRRFYRDINDNRKYPLSTWLAKHSIDRINTDRRFHISPPDVGTRFNIEDIYRPSESVVSIIKEIIGKSESGEILVFQPGSAEINKLVAELNTSGIMPPNTIALPYYAKMQKDKKEIVEQIHNELSNIKMSKLEDFTQRSVNAYEGSYSYTRAIIVSTNISEASITYPSLKYVIETGVEKTAVYDYKTRSNIIKPSGITEASRKQRRGRVGRNSPGTVYYMYEKDAMLMNRKQFNISVQDSHFSIFLKLLKDASDVRIFTKTVIDVMRGTYGASQVDANTVIAAVKQSYGLNSYSSKFVESIIDIITELYMPNGYYVPYAGLMYASTTHIASDASYGYPYDLYFSGYDYKQLTDPRGTFYIVHPDELVIDRNINGDVVRVIRDIELVDLMPLNPDIPTIQQKFMRSQKIRSFWLSLLDGRYCTIDGDRTIVKTVLGSIMEYCLSRLSKYAEFEENQDFMKMIVLAYGLSDTVDFNIILSAACYMIVADLKPVNIFREELESPSTLYGKYVHTQYTQSTQSQSAQKQSAKAILKRTKAILNPMADKLGHSDMSVLIKIVQIIDSLIKSANAEASQTEVTSNDVYDEKDLEARYRAISLKHEEFINKQITGLQQSSSMAILKGMGLNMPMLKRYLSLRQKMIGGIRDLILNVDDFKRAHTGFDKFEDIRKLFEDDRAIMTRYGIDALRASLLLSFPYSIVRKIDGTDYHYLSVYTPDLSTIYTIGSTSQNYYYPDTYVDFAYLQKYVHHATLNTEAGTLGVLTEIKPEYFALIRNVYQNKTYGMDTINTRPEAIQKYAELIRSRGTPRKNLDDLYAIDGARKTVQNIKHELTSVIGGSSKDAVGIEQILWGV